MASRGGRRNGAGRKPQGFASKTPVSVRMDPGLLALVDTASEQAGISRTEIIEQACGAFLVGLDDGPEAARMLRDKWVQIRRTRECDRCHSNCYHGEKMRHQVYVAGGEFFSTYLCIVCDGQGAFHREAIARA